ncbi:hypothetical protein [Pseudomonas sp. CAM1A]
MHPMTPRHFRLVDAFPVTGKVQTFRRGEISIEELAGAADR